MKNDDYKLLLRDDFAREVYIIKDTKLEQRTTKKKGVKEECALPSKLEYSVLLSLMAKVNGYEDNSFNSYSFTRAEFLKSMNITRKMTNTEIYQLLERVGSYRFRICHKDSHGNEHLTSYCFMPVVDHDKTNNIFTIQLHEDLMPFLLKNHPSNKIKNEDGKKPHFFTILIKYPLSLKSPYSIALYNFLKSYEFAKETPVMLERLKNLFSYKSTKDFKFKDFKRDILDKAIKEINEKTDLKISYSAEYSKDGINKLIFAIGKDGVIPKKPFIERVNKPKKSASKKVALNTKDVDIDDVDNVSDNEAGTVEYSDFEYEAEVKSAIVELTSTYKDVDISDSILQRLIVCCGSNLKLMLAVVYRALITDGDFIDNCSDLIFKITEGSLEDGFECELLMSYDSMLKKNRDLMRRNEELSRKSDVKRIVETYEDLIGPVTDKTRDEIYMAYETYFAYQIVNAIKKTAKSNGKSFAYVRKILEKGACGDRKNNLFIENSGNINNQLSFGYKNSGLSREELLEAIEKESNSSDENECFDFDSLRK